MKKYKLIAITLGSLGILYTLREFNLLSDSVLTWPILIATTLVVGFGVYALDQVCATNREKDTLHYENLDFMRYVCAIFIIIIHLRPFLGQMDRLDIFFNNIIGRLCVPLYFFVTGYFAAKKARKDPNYISRYIKGMLPLYIAWSIIYIPFALLWLKDYLPMGIDFVNGLALPTYLNTIIYIAFIPIALLIGFLYIGTYYHLWYFPALFFSLWIVDKARKRLSFKIILAISFALLLLGASETYYGMLPQSITHYLDVYFNVFITTRNFLFFGLFYVAFGYFIGGKRQLRPKHSIIKLCLCIFLLFIEAYFLLPTNRLNSNIMLSCVPLIYYLFFTLIQLNTIWTLPMKYSFRDYVKYYYLLHPMMIVFTQLFLYDALVGFSGGIHFLDLIVVLIVTHFGSVMLIRIKKRYPKCIL